MSIYKDLSMKQLLELVGVDVTKGKAAQLVESTGNNVKTETETGTATLQSDGTMVVKNKGYTQNLTTAQVKAAWSGAAKLPNSPETLSDMKKDGLSAAEIRQHAPTKKGGSYDFGEEMHVIPKKEEFNLKESTRNNRSRL